MNPFQISTVYEKTKYFVSKNLDNQSYLILTKIVQIYPVYCSVNHILNGK